MTDVPGSLAPARTETRGLHWIAAAGLILLSAFWLKATALINHDTAWFLYATKRWLDGAALYRDIVEVNPPLAFFLTAPAVLLSRQFGIGETAGLVGWIVGLSAISLGATHLLLRRLPGMTSNERGQVTVVLAFAAALLPAAMFGQREHFLIVFLLPYMALGACRLVSTAPSLPARVAIGAFAAAGLCLKPHFLLIPAALELLFAIRRRSLWQWRQPENMVMAALGMAYVAWTWFAYPEFFANILPWGAEAYVPYYGRAFSQVLLSALPVAGLALALTYWTLRHGGDAITTIFMVAAFAALAAYLLQAKGYLYQLMPAAAFTFLAAARIAIARLEWRGALPAVPAIAALYFAAEAATGQAYRYDLPDLTAAVERAGARSIFLVGVNVSASFPMVNELDLEWTSRFPAQWLLPYVAHEQALARAGRSMPKGARDAAFYALNATLDDLMKRPPDLIVVDERENKDYFRAPFDYIDFYRQDPRFEIFWRGYRLTGRAGSFALYRRTEP
jgi:hypothetical protein